MQQNAQDLNRLNQPKDFEMIYREQLEAGLKEYGRPQMSLFFSAFTAGLEVGFSIFLMVVLHSLYSDSMSEDGLTTIMAFAYPLGFLFVILGRSELFTEHTVLAFTPWLSKRVRFRRVIRLWLIIYVGNLIGGYLFSFLLVFFCPNLADFDVSSVAVLARHFIEYDWWVIVGSGMLAGWLMGLVSWLTTTAKETISQMIIIFIITTVIGLGGLHHCIVGSIEVFSGFLIDPNIHFSDYLYTQSGATLGNILGGTIFVSIMKYNHQEQ